MAIAAAGPIRWSDLRQEFGGSGPLRLSELRRGGLLVREKAANNTAVNLAQQVPAVGPIMLSAFRGIAKGFQASVAATTYNYSMAAAFGNDWGVDYPKTTVINAGVVVGAYPGQYAVTVSGGVGPIALINNGDIQGSTPSRSQAPGNSCG